MTDKLKELRRLVDERRSCLRTIEQAGFMDNHTDAARARARLYAIGTEIGNASDALIEVAEAARAIIRYEDEGADDGYRDWDRYYDALREKLRKLEGQADG